MKANFLLRLLFKIYVKPTIKGLELCISPKYRFSAYLWELLGKRFYIVTDYNFSLGGEFRITNPNQAEYTLLKINTPKVNLNFAPTIYGNTDLNSFRILVDGKEVTQHE